MVQANSGMYRVHDTYFEACKQKLQKQDSKVSSSEWGSIEAALWQSESQDSDPSLVGAVGGPPHGMIPHGLMASHGATAKMNPGEDDPRILVSDLTSEDVFLEEGSIDIDCESEWSIDIPNE